MKQYDKYKEADIVWLGRIPDHWFTLRAKTMFDKQNRDIKADYDVVTCFRDGVVTLRKNRRTTGFTESLKESGYQGIAKGDLVIHVMDAFAGAVGVSDSEGKGTPVYSVCTAKGEYNHYYYAHIIRIMAQTGFIQSLYRGIRERSSDFRFDVFGKQYLPIPSKDEQDQIVRYLDWKGSLINKFVKAKKREVALLKELKNAEINHAVTRGLNPEVPLNDSGIEWIGQVPEDWEIKNFSQYFTFGKGLPITKEDLRENGVEVISYGQIHSKLNNSIGLNESLIKYVSPFYLDTHAQSLLNRGDFVFADTSEDIDGSGNNIFINTTHPVFAGYHTLIIRAQNLECPEYYAYLFLSIRWKRQVQSLVNGVKVFSINKSILKKTKLLTPPLFEQREIVNYIVDKEQKINKAISDIEREIDLVKEYKARLISDVVTGKVDVRGIVVPDFQSESEVIEATEEEADDQTEIN